MDIDADNIERITYHADTILEIMLDGVVVTDTGGKIVYANRSAEKILGLSRDEILEAYYFDSEWNNIDSRGEPLQAEDLPLSRALNNLEKVDKFEHARVDKDSGKKVWLSINALPIFDKSGTLTGALATFRDITREKEIETQLEKARRFSNAVIDASGTLVVVMDREGRIQIFNKTCQKVTGYSAKDVIPRVLWEVLIPEEEVEEVKKVFQELEQGDFPSVHENSWLTKDGEKRHIAWSNTSIFGEHGEIEYVIGTGIDITERKMKEEETIRHFRQEISYLQGLIDSQTTKTTAFSYGQKPVSLDNSDIFQDFIDDFTELLDLRLEELAFKKSNHISSKLKKLAGRLGFVQAGPKDVMELYIKSLQRKLPSVTRQKIDGFTEEGRLLVLELMGYLVSYYRNYYTEGKDDV